jgi:hypothetical protein
MNFHPLSMVGGSLLGLSLALSCHGQESLPETTFVPLGQNSFRFDWKGEEGRTYFPQYSSNLVDWFYLPEIEQGPVHDPLDVTPLDGEGMPYPKLFMRLVKYSHPTLDPKNADFDGDGINNWQEITTFGTDPLKFISTGNGLPDGQDDSDLDGISDQWEQMLILQLGDPAITGIEDIGGLSDSDGDGVADYQEYQRGLNGYQTDSDGDGFSDRLSVDQSIYLKLNETAGSSASDASSEVRNGTLTGTPSWQAAGGIMDGALEFAGGTDGVDIPATAFDGLANLTVSLWFKTGSNAASQALLSAANSGQANELGIRLEQTTEAADTIQVDAGGGESFSWVRGSTLADDLWHHVVIVRNVANSQVTLYLDGAEVGTQSGTSFAPLDVEAATLARKHTGVLSFDSASAFVGNLDDLRVYSASLESTHSLELFQPNDLDLDGLPDDWEIDQVENLSTLAAAADDLDGDGLTNRQEFENGTDPTDYFNGATPVVTLVSGSGQWVYNGQRTNDPLVFKVTSDGTAPLVGAPVTLEHLGLLGSVETLDGDRLASSLILTTDSNGEVSVHFKAD